MVQEIKLLGMKIPELHWASTPPIKIRPIIIMHIAVVGLLDLATSTSVSGSIKYAFKFFNFFAFFAISFLNLDLQHPDEMRISILIGNTMHLSVHIKIMIRAGQATMKRQMSIMSIITTTNF
jgi:hypothetical protein